MSWTMHTIQLAYSYKHERDLPSEDALYREMQDAAAEAIEEVAKKYNSKLDEEVIVV